MKYPWVKKLNEYIPDVPYFDLFNTDKVSIELSNRIKHQIKIDPKSFEWIEPEQINVESLYKPAIKVGGISGHCCMMIEKRDVEQLIKLLLKHEKCPESIKEEYLCFVLLESLDVIQNLHSVPDLSFSLDMNCSLEKEIYCIKEYLISIDDKNITVKLAFSKSFHMSLKDHLKKHLPNLIGDEALQKTTLNMGVELTKITLAADKLQNLSVGDWILCNKIDYNSDTGTGRGNIVLGDITLAGAKIEKESFSIEGG